MTTFRYLRPDDWGMTWVRPPQPEAMPDPEVYVHHTAGCHPNDAVAALQGLNAYATRPKDQDGKGYSALDYDVLVHRNPTSGLVTIAEGRGRHMSAATLDRNELGEAVCLLGTFHPSGPTCRRQPHPDEIEGVALAIRWGIDNGWIAESARILGHRDNPAHPNATTCPGDWLYAHLPTIRRRVTELSGPAPAPVPVPQPSPDGSLQPHGWYRLRAGEWPWSVARRILGDGRRHAEITAINRPVSEWEPGSFVAIPNVPSVLVTVRSGEGLHAVIRRAIPGEDPRSREAAVWEWNGGVHTLKANEVVSVPVYWQP